MEMTTVIPYALFLLACFGLAWSLTRTFIQASAVLATVTAKQNVNWNFKLELWLIPLCFTYIMGYIFIL